MERLKRIIAKIDTPVWLEFLFGLIIILRIPSFFEPFYYGDEMIYLSLGQGMRNGLSLYSQLHDNKPPLLYVMAAIAGNVFWFKVLLAIASLVAIYLFWKLIKEIFPSKEGFHKISTILFSLLTTLPLLEGNIANAELFMIVPTLGAMLLVVSKEFSVKKAFIAGFLFSIASLFKIVAAFDILGVVAFLLIFTKRQVVLENIKKIVFLSIGFVIPILITFIWFWFNGAFKEYLVAAFLQNIGYVSSWRPQDVAKPFIERNAPLLIRAIIMFIGFIVLFLSKKKISKSFIFISAWLLASLFAVTLSERPYPHYLIQSVAPISVLLGILLTSRKIEQTLAIIPLTVAFFVPFYYKFWYYPTVSYYQRFIQFATKQITKEQYFDKFSQNINRNYKIAQFLVSSSNKNDRIFVWSNDSSAIYALSRRLPPIKYVADYHFIDFSNKEETLKMLSEKMPKFIIITPNSFSFPELRDFAKTSYMSIDNIDSAEIWIKKEVK